MRRRSLCLVIAAALTLVGCSGEPSSTGAECDWPAELDLQRDAVLYDSYDGGLALVDASTGEVRASCTHVTLGTASLASVPLQVDGRSYGSPTWPQGSVVFSPLAPERRTAVTDDGVVDLVTGETRHLGGLTWATAALPGAGRVLLGQRPPQDRPPDASDYERGDAWCLLPATDVPINQCQPITDANEPGTPVVHADGTVGWARAVAVPLELDGIRGFAQTDGKRLVRAEVLPPESKTGGSGAVLDASGRAALLDSRDLRLRLGLEPEDPQAQRIAWFTVDSIGANGVAATLHRSIATWQTLSAEVDGRPLAATSATGVAVVDNGRAIVVLIPDQAADRQVAVRVDEDGGIRRLAAIDWGGTPLVLSWPG
ncbi:MAG: hypothetical protein ACT4NY_10015 [Pseudonocardiales bacterium]